MVRTDPGLISKYHATSADGSSSNACVPTCGAGVYDQESVWGIYMNVLSDMPLLLNAFGPCGQWSNLIAERNPLPFMIRRRVRSSFCVIVFNRRPCSPWTTGLTNTMQDFSGILDISHRGRLRSENWTIISIVTGWILVGMISTLVWDAYLHTARAHS